MCIKDTFKAESDTSLPRDLPFAFSSFAYKYETALVITLPLVSQIYILHCFIPLHSLRKKKKTERDREKERWVNFTLCLPIFIQAPGN